MRNLKHPQVFSVLVCISIFCLTLPSINLLTIREAIAFEPIIQPWQGDYLRYTITSFDMFGFPHSTSFNLTFSLPPFNITIPGGEFEFNSTDFPDFVKATVEVSNWVALEIAPEPEGEVWMIVNVTDRSRFGSYPFDHAPLGSTPYFEFIIPTDVNVGTEIVFLGAAYHKGTVVEADNVFVGGQQYPVWIVLSQYGDYLNLYKFEASTGILLSKNTTNVYDQSHVGTIDIIEARIGDFVVIPEFPSLLNLPLFMIASLLAGLLYRRKMAKPQGHCSLEDNH